MSTLHETDSPKVRKARVFRNGRNQAIRIPKDFELLEDEVTITKEEDRLIIEPLNKSTGLIELISGWTTLNVAFSDVDTDLQPLDDVEL